MCAARVLFVGPRWAEFPGGRLGSLGLEVLGPHPYSMVERLLERESPDVAVVDADGDPGAYGVVLQAFETSTPCRVVLLVEGWSRQRVRDAFRAGAYACLSKPVRRALVRPVILRAAEATATMRRCLGGGEPRPVAATSSPHDALTVREREVLRHVLEGRSTDAIAHDMGITSRTVKFHIGNLLRKAGVGSRLELVAKRRPRAHLLS